MKPKSFPCPYCKGEGSFLEDMIEWYEIRLPCWYCDSKGMIEIDGPIHKAHKKNKVTAAVYDYLGDDYVLPSHNALQAKVEELIAWADTVKMTVAEHNALVERSGG